MTKHKVHILSLGLDSFLSGKLKDILKKRTFSHYQLSMATDLNTLSTQLREKVDVVFFFSAGQFSQTLREIQNLRYHLPLASIVLITPKNDPYQLVSFFRLGVKDVLLFPLDNYEIEQVLERLDPHHVDHQTHNYSWDPMRAILHFFSQRQVFSSWSDIEESLRNYLGIYFKISLFETHESFAEINEFVGKRSFPEKTLRKWKRFLKADHFYFASPHQDQTLVIIRFDHSKWVIMEGVGCDEWGHEEIFSDYFFHLLQASIEHCHQTKKQKEMLDLSHTDEVTGLFNQRKLNLDLEEQIELHQAGKIDKFSLLFIDIDYFKLVNDQFGHIIGSRMLNDMADVLRSELRGNDLMYRFGGDEFIVLLSNTGLETSKNIAKRIAKSVKEKRFQIDESQTYRLSLSVGIAEFPTDAQSAAEVIDFADKMMYMSKRSGRGKIFHVNEVA